MKNYSEFKGVYLAVQQDIKDKHAYVRGVAEALLNQLQSVRVGFPHEQIGVANLSDPGPPREPTPPGDLSFELGSGTMGFLALYKGLDSFLPVLEAKVLFTFGPEGSVRCSVEGRDNVMSGYLRTGTHEPLVADLAEVVADQWGAAVKRLGNA